MVSIEISAIITGVGVIIFALLAYFGNRAFATYDRRLAAHDERAKGIDAKVDEIKETLDILLGEHNAIKGQCVKPRRRK